MTSRATFARIRRMRIGDIEYEVPKYIHRNMTHSGWSVVVAGISKLFSDHAYGSTKAALQEAKVFLARAVHTPDESLVRYASIRIQVQSSHNGQCPVHGIFRDARTGKDMCIFVGNVKPDVEFWPSVSFDICDIPSWLTGLDFKPLQAAWLEMHRKHLKNVYLMDDFCEFLKNILTTSAQLELAI